MIIKSNPFLRNDYYPDQNDIDDLNTRINEVQSDVDLLAISVNEKAEAVNGRLNNLQNDYNESFETEALKANTADFNVLNVNVQATIKDLNAENTYIENLIVNKPVQDLSLRTPHLENTTSLNGNFYAPNILGGVFDSIQFENIQNFKAVNIEADEVKANIADFNEVKANIADLNNLNAMNIEVGEVKANIVNLNVLNADSLAVNNLTVNNLMVNEPVFDITLNTPSIENANSNSGNFYDATLVNPTFENVDSLAVNNLTVNKPMLNLALSAPNIESANSNSGNFYNATLVNPTFEELDTVNANYLNVNSANVAELFVNTNSEPITSNAVLGYDSSGRVIPIKAPLELPENANYIFTDEHGTALPGKAETEVNASDNLITSNAVKNVTDNLSSYVDYLMGSLNALLSLPATNVSGWNNSASPLNIQSMTDFVVFPFSSGSTSGADVGNGARLDFDSASKVATLYIPGIQWTMGNMDNTFNNCRLLNKNILIPNSVTNMTSTFASCLSLNRNIFIPGGVISMNNAFNNCISLNQNILIPGRVNYMESTFQNCHNLNQNILIPNGVLLMDSTFADCTNLNQNILIPNSVASMYNTFNNCISLNQSISIPNNVVNIGYTFANCTNLNQNILIHNKITSIIGTFRNCTNLNQSILIPNKVAYMHNAFQNCTNLNISDMYIYSQNLRSIDGAFNNCNRIGNIHVPTSVPKVTSNYIYNSLVNGYTGITFAPENIINDLPVDPVYWPPIN